MFTTSLQERQPLAGRLLQAAAERRSLANAYLLTGPARGDKWELTLQLAAALNCTGQETVEQTSCLTTVPQSQEKWCLNCRWISRGEHPQAWLLLKREPDKSKIPVDKARLLCEEILKSSAFFRVIVITEAEQKIFHEDPANALLKSIEEPGPRCMFVLFAVHSDAVLPTIVSRCQVVEITGAYTPGFICHSADKLGAETKQVLEANRHQFLMEFPAIAKNASSLRFGSVNYVIESRAIADRLVKLVEEHGLPAPLVIDAYVSADFEALKNSATDYSGALIYLNRLLSIAETAKQDLDHYVKLNNVVETFAYSVAELRSHFSGELRLAIRI